MGRDGKRLEALVALAEEKLVPKGFKVEINQRVFNEEGVQIAEFDVTVTGKIGTSDFQWLIECRDRPSSGAAPVSWIEQLVGRRDRFNFNKVTAVSTTGFAAGALEFAQIRGIELREVADLTPEHFADWLDVPYITQIIRKCILAKALFGVGSDLPQDVREALVGKIRNLNPEDPMLISTVTGEAVTASQAFVAVVNQNGAAFDGLEANGGSKIVDITAQYPDDDHFIISTAAGEAHIREIRFTGKISIEESRLPIVFSGAYRNVADGTPISEVVSYAPQTIAGSQYSVEFHRLADTGEIHVAMRRTKGSP